MIKFRILTIFIAFILSLGFTAPLDAELISFDDPVFGDNSITLDTDTGLEWLDLTKSTNRSFNDVSNELGVGGDFAGFRYASIDEINTFWANAGIPNIESFTEANLEPVASLMSLIGCTNTCSSEIVVSSIGLSGSFASVSSIYMPAMNQLLANKPPVGGAILISNISPITSPGYPHIGSWLARSTTVIDVSIDIKPGNIQNVINPRSQGKVWVAMLSNGGFDPLQVEISTVHFGPKKAKTANYHVKDLNKDGLADLLLQFKIPETGITCEQTEATLRANLYGGPPITGSDSIKTVGCEFPRQQIFSSTGVFTVPKKITQIEVQLWGGGGGGGGGRVDPITCPSGAGGGGGGSGGYSVESYTVTPGDWYTVAIGSAGNSGGLGSGGSGGYTKFYSLSAQGGKGGTGAKGCTPGPGGPGGYGNTAYGASGENAVQCDGGLGGASAHGSGGDGGDGCLGSVQSGESGQPGYAVINW